MDTNSLGTAISSWLDRRPATGQDDPAGIDAKDKHWLLSTVACSSGGDIDAWIEESDDNVTFTEVSDSRVTIDAQTQARHMVHTFVTDLQKRERYVRPNFAATGGSPATSLTSLLIFGQTNIAGGPYPEDAATAGMPGSVSQV